MEFRLTFCISFLSNKDSGAVSIVVLQLIGGLITTLTFIKMMKSSQSSPKSMRSTQFVL
jgi:hypothetical protein